MRKKIAYDRRKDTVIFGARYKGKIKQGFFTSQIYAPSSFNIGTPNMYLSNNHIPSNYVTSFCSQTINDLTETMTVENISKDTGNLDSNNIDTKWLEWEWKIPEFAPLGDYTVRISVWSWSEKDNRVIRIQSSNNSFMVIDPDSSHYLGHI